MRLSDLFYNVRQNALPLLLIIVVAGIVGGFQLRGVLTEPDSGDAEAVTLTIRLYKGGKSANEQFGKLKVALEKAFNKEENGFILDIKFEPNLQALCRDLDEGDVDIGGELSPIEYVNTYRSHKFSPLLGIEFNGSAYYYSVLFVRNDREFDGTTFGKGLGEDNLRRIMELVGPLKDDRDGDDDGMKRVVAYSADQSSTSGYWYPKSYLLRHDVHSEHLKELAKHRDIYEKVICKGDYVAGFLAEFRLDIYKSEQEQCEGYPKPLNLKKFEPLIVDKSAPIPNGVFVISKAAKQRFSRGPKGNTALDRLVRVWKTVKDVKIGPKEVLEEREPKDASEYEMQNGKEASSESKTEDPSEHEKHNGKVTSSDSKPEDPSEHKEQQYKGSFITGWRTNLDHDLKLVEFHKQCVDYGSFGQQVLSRDLTILIALVIAVVGALVALFYTAGRG